MAKKYKAEHIVTSGIDLQAGLLSGAAPAVRTPASIGPSGYLHYAEIDNLDGNVGHFEELYLNNVPVCVPPCGETETNKNLYGFWYSGCNTEHLYVDIGELNDVGWDPHEHYASGYRSYFFDVSGVNVHITGKCQSGLLTFEYPEE